MEVGEAQARFSHSGPMGLDLLSCIVSRRYLMILLQLTLTGVILLANQFYRATPSMERGR